MVKLQLATNCLSVWLHTPHHLPTNQCSLSQLPVVRSEHERRFFDRTQSHEYKSEYCSQEFYEAMHIKTTFGKALYLGSLYSNLRTVSDGTQSQQSNSDACANEFYVAICFKTPFLTNLMSSPPPLPA